MQKRTNPIKGCGKAKEQITAYIGDQFVIPHDCKHIALLGCTPHPTQYLMDHDNNKELIRNIHIEDFLDIEYVTDSFVRTFEICKNEQIDHLIIAYLPIYFVRMRPILGDQFVPYSRMFLNNIVPEIKKLIEHAAHRTGYIAKTILISPTDQELSAHS